MGRKALRKRAFTGSRQDEQGLDPQSLRRLDILRAVVQAYISGGQPVGSGTIADRLDCEVSSATVRTEMAKLEEMLQKVETAYDNYEFHVLYHAVHNFCAVELSSFSLDIIKDRLYTSKSDGLERRSAQTVIWKTLDAITRVVNEA